MTSVEDFKKHTPIQHVLERPDSYIGSIETTSSEKWIITNDTSLKVSSQIIKYNPGLDHCISEVITNAIDHVQRCLEFAKTKPNTEQVSKIEVSIDKNSFTIKNNGQGIPIELHPVEKIYIPELIFGNMMTSSNYDDTKQRKWGGLNGYGIKLMNIFSKEFTIELVCNGQKYIQTWSDNMSKKTDPKITKSAVKDYTKIITKPDFKRFNLTSFDDPNGGLGTKQLIEKRVYDMSAVTSKKVSITLNDKKISLKDFKDYVDMFLNDPDLDLEDQSTIAETATETSSSKSSIKMKKVYYETEDGNWSIAFALNPFDLATKISFVNGIFTENGGTHVKHVLDPVAKRVAEEIQNMAKVKRDSLTIKEQWIKDNLIVFVKCLIGNPSFSSQTKNELTLLASKFDTKCWPTTGPPDDIIKKITKLGLVDNIIETARTKELQSMKKATASTGSRKTRVNVDKLDDAIWAGTAKSNKCTLILCEGNSAAGTALQGLTVVGNNEWGVFPLKGKVLNVRKCSMKQLKENTEIANINTILGLNYDMKDKSKMRYNKIMIMADQDSVCGDTPLLLREPNTGRFVIKNIEDLTETFTTSLDNKKEYGLSDFEVWTEKGFTKIKHVMRHKTTKDIYRVLTHTGIVDVSEDHSLLNLDGSKISPTECQVGTSLLHSFPMFSENKVEIPDDLDTYFKPDLLNLAAKINLHNRKSHTVLQLKEKLTTYKNTQTFDLNSPLDITPDEAWVMGFFLADGSGGIFKSASGRTNNTWHLYNANMKLLEKSRDILNKIYGNFFKILTLKTRKLRTKTYPTVSNILPIQIIQPEHILTLYKPKTNIHIIEKYRKYLYYKKCKYIHPDLLNASRIIRERLFEGYYEGDGMHDPDVPKQFPINSKISAHCLYFLCKSIGYNVSMGVRPVITNTIQFIVSKNKYTKDPEQIKKIIKLPKTEQFVYDLETENHHFQAGAGSLIVHNTDGLHIKGLLMNYFTFYFPEIVHDNFISTLLTPIVKVSIPKPLKIIEFYNEYEFEDWVLKNKELRYTHKYYKGLGTSKSEEAKDYFKNISKNTLNYTFNKSDLKRLELAFDDKREDDRKAWISDAITKLNNKQLTVDYNIKQVPIGSFIDSELVMFSIADCARSLPSMIDGLKESQRKVLYGSLRKNLYNELKVSELGAYVSEHTAYLHGDVSLTETIVKMAQEFVGSNNTPLLKPCGFFGSRNMGGKDAASSRYIFTHLMPWIPLIYKSEDKHIIKYNYEDLLQIEPVHYAPVLPMILVNGAEGIATGWSSNVPMFKPIDVINNIRNLLADKPIMEMIPYCRYFKGTITKKDSNKWVSHGSWIKKKQDIHILELPIGVWYSNYKGHLKDLEDKELLTFTSKPIADKNKQDYEEYDIKLNKDYEEVELVKLLKLESNINATNLVGFDQNSCIKKYNSAEEILTEFYSYRLTLYQKRKEYLEQELNEKLILISEKARFIRLFIEKKLIIINRSEEDVSLDLVKLKFNKIDDSYDYLLNLSLKYLTINKIKSLETDIQKLTEELVILRNKNAKDLWADDLDLLKDIDVFMT